MVCRVSDSGPGVDPQHAERIFDPFFTTKAPGEGTGLGLANARRLAEEMGGEVELECRTFGPRRRLLPVRAPGRRGEPAGGGGAQSRAGSVADFVVLQLVEQGAVTDLEQACGMRAIAARSRQCPPDQVGFEDAGAPVSSRSLPRRPPTSQRSLLPRPLEPVCTAGRERSRPRSRRRPSRSPRARSRSRARARCPASRRRRGARVLRPTPGGRSSQSATRNCAEKMIDEQRDVLPPDSQRRDFEAHDVQAVEEILAESSRSRSRGRGREPSRRSRARRPTAPS